MRVVFFSAGAVVFNEYGECAKIEGRLFHELLKTFQDRKAISRKSDKRIVREIVESWPREKLEWVSVEQANG